MTSSFSTHRSPLTRSLRWLRSRVSQEDTTPSAPLASEVIPHYETTNQKDTAERTLASILHQSNAGARGTTTTVEPRCFGSAGVDGEQLGDHPGIDSTRGSATASVDNGSDPSAHRTGDTPRAGLGDEEGIRWFPSIYAPISPLARLLLFQGLPLTPRQVPSRKRQFIRDVPFSRPGDIRERVNFICDMKAHLRPDHGRGFHHRAGEASLIFRTNVPHISIPRKHSLLDHTRCVIFNVTRGVNIVQCIKVHIVHNREIILKGVSCIYRRRRN